MASLLEHEEIDVVGQPGAEVLECDDLPAEHLRYAPDSEYDRSSRNLEPS